MSEKKRKTCAICGGEFVPINDMQKHCPVCQQAIKEGKPLDKRVAYVQAAKPGPVLKYTLELKETQEAEDTKQIDLPDGLAMVEQYTEVLRRHCRGELVDKAELVARIRSLLNEFLDEI